MFHHPCCSDQKIRTLQCLFSFLCQSICSSHTDSHKRYLLPPKDILSFFSFGYRFCILRCCFLHDRFLRNLFLPAAGILYIFYIFCISIDNFDFCIICNIFFREKPAIQILYTFLQFHALFFLRSSDDNHPAAGFFCRLIFFQESSGSSRFFTYHPCDIKLMDQCDIHFPGKRSLHAQQMFPFDAKFCAGSDNFHQRKHSGIDSFLIIGQCRIGRQFFAPGGNQNISTGFFQIFHRFPDAFYICNGFFFFKTPAFLTHHPQIGSSGTFAGGLNIFRHYLGIRMSRIDDQPVLHL